MGFDLKGIFRNLLPARPQAPALTVHQRAAWEHGQGLFREMLSTYGVHDRLQSGQTLENVAMDLSDAVLASSQKKYLLLYLAVQAQHDSKEASLDGEIGSETLKMIRIKGLGENLHVMYPWSLEFYPYLSRLHRSQSLLPEGAHFFITGYHEKEDSPAESPTARTPPARPVLWNIGHSPENVGR